MESAPARSYQTGASNNDWWGLVPAVCLAAGQRMPELFTAPRRVCARGGAGRPREPIHLVDSAVTTSRR